MTAPVRSLRHGITCPNCGKPWVGIAPAATWGIAAHGYRCERRSCRTWYVIAIRGGERAQLLGVVRCRGTRPQDLLEALESLPSISQAEAMDAVRSSADIASQTGARAPEWSGTRSWRKG